MKSTKKSFIMSFLAVLLCVAMLVGTTFAWFTDSVTSGKNKIVAGNLDIEVTHTNASVAAPESIQNNTSLFRDVNGSAMLWEPGAVSYENFTVSNVGNLALKYKLAMNITDYNALNGHTLKEVLKVKVLSGDDVLTNVNRDAVAALDWNTTDTLDAFNTAGDLQASASDAFQVIVYWQPTENDNLWNVNNGQVTSDGDPLFIDFGINVVATQKDYESDSFDNTYDKGLVLPDLPVSINKTFESAPITTEEVTDDVVVKNVSTNSGVATVPAEAVNAVVDKLLELAEDKAEDSDISTVIYLDVQTESKTDTAVTYNIDLSAVMTYKDSNNATQTKTLESLDGEMADQIVTANMNIGKGLSDVTVKHNTTAMAKLASATADGEGFFYDKDTGVLTIKSKSFSPFKVSYTLDADAFIGNEIYNTLAEAVKAAKAGDVIGLLNNVTLTSRVDVDKSVTIDLNGKTVGSTASCANGSVFDVKNGATVTVKNGKLVGIAGPTGLPNPYTNECDVIVVRSGGLVNVENVDISINCRTGCCVYAFNGGVANIKSGTFTNSAEDYDENGTTKAMLLNQADVATQLIFVTGGTFKGENPANGDNSGLVTTFVAEGYKSYANTELSAWTVRELQPVVQNVTKNAKYTSWEAAMAAASSGDELKLLETIYPTQNMTFDKSLTIDMNNYGFVRAAEASGGYKINLKPNCDLTMKNGTWAMAATFGDITAEGSEGTCNVKFENVKFNNLNTYTTEELLNKPGNSNELAMNCFKANMQGDFTVNAVFTDCVFNNAKVEFSGYNSGNTFDATFTNCKFTSITNSEAIYVKGYGMTENCKLTVTGCTFDLTATSSVAAIRIERFNSSNNSAIAVTITDNTVKGAIADNTKYLVNDWASVKLYDLSMAAAATVTADGNTAQGIATLS